MSGILTARVIRFETSAFGVLSHATDYRQFLSSFWGVTMAQGSDGKAIDCLVWSDGTGYRALQTSY